MFQEVPMWLAILGWFIGGAFGLMIACLMAISRQGDDREHEEVRQRLRCAQCALKSEKYMSDMLKGLSAKKGA